MTVSTPVESTMHRVLSIPELLDLVFSFNDEVSNANCACVCKRWSEVALDCLWREVDDLSRLFKLLGPITHENSRNSFRSVPGPDDWKRFMKYGRRVRRLSFHAFSDKSRKFLVSAIDVIARTRTTLEILPNSNSLTWIADFSDEVDCSIIFMHEKVRNFTFAVIPPEFRSFAQNVVSRMPFLTCLDIRVRGAPASINECQPYISDIIRGQPKLEKIVVPNYWLTTEMMQELSKLDNLGVIQFEFLDSQGVGISDDVQSLSPVLEEGAFPALWDLSISAHLSDMSRFLTMKHAPVYLTSIFIHSLAMESPSAIQHFLVIVSETCPHIHHLYLDLLKFSSASAIQGGGERITLQTLEPLFACTDLVTFELTHEYSLAISHEELEIIATKWPAIETLILNNEPLSPDKSPLTLRAVLPFATHCPNLQALGLYVDATAADLPTETPKPFARLAKLSVGVSGIQEVGPVSIFLSRVLPLGCEIEYGASWAMDLTDSDLGEGRLRQLGVRCDNWGEVEHALPLLIKSGMEERQRTLAMLSRIEDLEARNGVLMDSARVKKDDGCVVC